MPSQASHDGHALIWLGAASLAVLVCLGCPAVFVAAQSQLPASGSFMGSLAGGCLEWGANVAGRAQVGAWWEATDVGVARLTAPPNSALHIVCATLPWSPSLPARGAYIQTW